MRTSRCCAAFSLGWAAPQTFRRRVCGRQPSFGRIGNALAAPREADGETRGCLRLGARTTAEVESPPSVPSGLPRADSGENTCSAFLGGAFRLLIQGQLKTNPHGGHETCYEQDQDA